MQNNSIHVQTEFLLNPPPQLLSEKKKLKNRKKNQCLKAEWLFPRQQYSWANLQGTSPDQPWSKMFSTFYQLS